MGRPIIFSGAMVCALLEGRKTMTRRIIKWNLRDPGLNLNFSGLHAVPLKTNGTPIGTWTLDSRGQGGCWEERGTVKTYAPGDRLYVRESFRPSDMAPAQTIYRADVKPEAIGPWTPSIHMPRARSRITLTVEAVKVERLQDISGMDAKAEGVSIPAHMPQDGADLDWARLEFQKLWQSLNAKRAPWDSNPWVVAVSFSIIKENIDSLKSEAA